MARVMAPPELLELLTPVMDQAARAWSMLLSLATALCPLVPVGSGAAYAVELLLSSTSKPVVP